MSPDWEPLQRMCSDESAYQADQEKRGILYQWKPLDMSKEDKQYAEDAEYQSRIADAKEGFES